MQTNFLFESSRTIETLFMAIISENSVNESKGFESVDGFRAPNVSAMFANTAQKQNVKYISVMRSVKR